MKLWKAQIRFDKEVVVAADTKWEASFELDVDDVLSDFKGDISVYWDEIKKPETMPTGWEDSDPYGDYEEGTCGQIMLEIIERTKQEEIKAERDKNQLKLDIDIEPIS